MADPGPLGQHDVTGADAATPQAAQGGAQANAGAASLIPVRASGGGIWISRDSGATWSRPPSAVPLATRKFANIGVCPPRYSARGIHVDFNGKIYVGTDCGVAMSDNRGVSWTHVPVSGLSRGRRIHSIASLVGGKLLAGSRDGVYWSLDNGKSWTRDRSASLAENVLFIRSIAATPIKDTAFVASRQGLSYVEYQGRCAEVAPAERFANIRPRRRAVFC